MPVNRKLSRRSSKRKVEKETFAPVSNSGDGEGNGAVVRAVVRNEGYISLLLTHDMVVDIAVNKAVRVVNARKFSVISLSNCGTQMALNHPKGKVKQSNSTVEVQAWNVSSYKSAKISPRGIYFTARSKPLSYLIDEGGVKTANGVFHNLYTNDIASNLFLQSCHNCDSLQEAARDNAQLLEEASFSKTALNEYCWVISGVKVIQAYDGFVTVERIHGNEHFIIKSSPNNGKVRFESSFLYVTASLGPNAHLFAKTNDRRIHSSAEAIIVRNKGHTAGFDYKDDIKIW